MDSINSTVIDSCNATKRETNFIEKYPGVAGDSAAVCKDSETTVCISTGLSSFGSVTSLGVEAEAVSDSAILKDFSAADKMFSSKSYSERADDFVKSSPWIPSKVFPTKLSASPESSQSSLASTPSQGEMCKFIKDEQEPSLIMDPRASDFDVTSNVPAVNSCYNNSKKGQFDFMVDVPSFPSYSAGQQVVLSSSPTIFVDLNQSTARQPYSEIRGEPGKGMASYDMINTPSSQQHLFVCKSEVPRWPLQQSSADGQVWCQSVEVTDDQHHPVTYSSPDGFNAGYLQRSPHTYSTYSG